MSPSLAPRAPRARRRSRNGPDDHVLHLQHIHGILQHRQAVQVGVHDDVGDVAVDEELAGERPTISLAGTRLSEQPIQRYSGACWDFNRWKKSGCRATHAAAQRRLFSNNSGRSCASALSIQPIIGQTGSDTYELTR